MLPNEIPIANLSAGSAAALAVPLLMVDVDVDRTEG